MVKRSDNGRARLPNHWTWDFEYLCISFLGFHLCYVILARLVTETLYFLLQLEYCSRLMTYLALLSYVDGCLYFRFTLKLPHIVKFANELVLNILTI